MLTHSTIATVDRSECATWELSLLTLRVIVILLLRGSLDLLALLLFFLFLLCLAESFCCLYDFNDWIEGPRAIVTDEHGRAAAIVFAEYLGTAATPARAVKLADFVITQITAAVILTRYFNLLFALSVLRSSPTISRHIIFLSKHKHGKSWIFNQAFILLLRVDLATRSITPSTIVT